MSINSLIPIEFLVINDNYDLQEAAAVLSYVPRLRRLSIKNQCESYGRGAVIVWMVLNNLIHISLTGVHIRFDNIEPFIQKIFSAN